MKQKFRNTVMITELLSTVQPTGVGDASPTGGNGTSPEPQPHGAASPASSLATQVGSASVK